MVYDFDVHHGNGTQDIFYNDPSVLFISSRQNGIYPGADHKTTRLKLFGLGTGRMTEVGSGNGEGTNINIPLPAGSGEIAALSTFEQIVGPAAEKFKPDMIVVSAGYDAHFLDPLASLQFASSTYHVLCQNLRQLADRLCHGRLVLLLEGGYRLQALGDSVTDSFLGLMNHPSIDKCDRKSLQDEPSENIKDLLKEVSAIHCI